MARQGTGSALVSEEAAEVIESMLGSVPDIPPVQEALGARLESVDKGQAVFAMDASQEHHNMIDVVHGGIITSLAELAASVAILTAIDDDQAFTFVSQTTNYEEPVIDGRVEAHAEVIRRGSRISFIEVIVDQEGGESARAEFTALVQQIGD